MPATRRCRPRSKTLLALQGGVLLLASVPGKVSFKSILRALLIFLFTRPRGRRDWPKHKRDCVEIKDPRQRRFDLISQLPEGPFNFPPCIYADRARAVTVHAFLIRSERFLTINCFVFDRAGVSNSIFSFLSAKDLCICSQPHQSFVSHYM